MMRNRLVVLFLLALMASSLALPVSAQANIQVVSDKAAPSFPESVQFSAEFKSTAKITSVVLQYGNVELTCGTVQAEAFPDVTAGTDVSVQWTWEMRQSGGLPPGVSIWWQWLVTTADGAQFTSPKQTIEWIDNIHPWKTISGGNINLHYYDGDTTFGTTLHDTAVAALQRLAADIGLTVDKPVDIFIYGTQSDMLSAIVFSTVWEGGQAFPENGVVTIAAGPNDLDYGKSTEAHELTHILVHRLTYSCVSFMPLWLDEGLAVYGEGGRSDMTNALNNAISSDQVPSLLSLTGNFSADPNRALTSYGVSYSVVNYMIKTYGKDKMLSLLKDLKAGQAMDPALQAVYGFDTNGLDNEWLKSVNAPVHGGTGQATPEPTPTIIPTIIPIGAVPIAQSSGSTLQPTTALATDTPASLAQAPSQPVSSTPARTTNIGLILGIGGACVVAALVIIGVVVFFAVRRGQRRPQ